MKPSPDLFELSLGSVLRSETFKRAPKIQSLLSFLAHKTLTVGADQVTPGLVASEFFGTSEPEKLDKSSLHRVQVSRLKRLLAKYYEDEGRDERWLLTVAGSSYGLQLAPSYQDPSNFSPRVIVIPFRNLGGSTHQEDICIGLAFELTHLLAQSKRLRVFQPFSELASTERPTSTATLMAEQTSDFAVEGSVRFTPNGYEVLARLKEIRSKQVLWSQKFDLLDEPSSLFEAQNEIALKIASVLASPSGVIDRALSLKPPDGSAYMAVLRFYAYAERYTPESHAAAKQALLEVVRDAPRYSEAWACLSGVYWNEYAFGFSDSLSSQASLKEAIRCAQHALAITPDCVTALYSLATSYYQQGNKTLFQSYAHKALSCAPFRSDVLAGLGLFNALLGQWDEAFALMDRARDINPLHPAWYWVPYYVNEYRLNRMETAMDYLQQVNVGQFPHSLLFVAAVELRRSKYPEALAAFESLKKIYPDLSENLDLYLERLFPHSEVRSLLLVDLDAVRTVGKG